MVSSRKTKNEIFNLGNQVADQILDYLKDPSKIFSSESEMKKAIYGALEDKSKIWRKPRPCMFKGCKNKSISRSHTIQRSGPLSEIAERGHVCTPVMLPGELKIKEVGLDSASTFAGFCLEHEKIFSLFEVRGQISTEEHVLLQIFRTLCREIVMNDFQLNQINNAMAKFQARIKVKSKSLCSTLGIEMKDFTLEGGVLGKADRTISNLEETKKHLESMYEALFCLIKGNSNNEYCIASVKINFKTPIALSGIGFYNWQDKNILCLLGIFPAESGTIFSMCCKSEYQTIINNYMSQFGMKLTMLNIIESWMIRGTDHWFLTPSVWNSISEEKIESIYSELLDDRYGIEKNLTFSVFGDLRRQFINEAEAESVPTEWEGFLKSEKDKLA